MWVVLVIFNNKQSNISQEAYKTYNEALAEMKKKDIKQLDDYKFYDIENEIIYELKNVYIK
jgi:hypothetical protein